MPRKVMDVLSLFTPSRTVLGVTEAAALLKRPKSTVSRWMNSMADVGFLRRDPKTQQFFLGGRLAAFGELYRHATPIQKSARPMLEWLVEVTGETAIIAVEELGMVLNLDAAESPRPIRGVGSIGRRLPLHATAAGKTLLAWRGEAVIREVVGASLETLTPNTVATVDALLAELEQVRRNGYSTSDGEFDEHLVAVCAPVLNAAGEVIAAVSIAGPSTRLPKQLLPSLAESVMAAGRRISKELGYMQAIQSPQPNGDGVVEGRPSDSDRKDT